MKYLTTGEYANLRGCSERYVRKLIQSGNIEAEEIMGVVGNSGKQYRIPLASIEPKYIKNGSGDRQKKTMCRKHQRRKQYRCHTSMGKPWLVFFTSRKKEGKRIWKTGLRD